MHCCDLLLTCATGMCGSDAGTRHEIELFMVPYLQETYGDEAVKWWVRWRLFYISCSAFFGAKDGTASGVGHYLFRRK